MKNKKINNLWIKNKIQWVLMRKNKHRVKINTTVALNTQIIILIIIIIIIIKIEK